MSNEVTRQTLISWVEAAIKDEDILNYEIDILGKSEKGDGYVGEIVFAKVDGVSKENKPKEFNLVLKHGKSNINLRDAVPVRSAFETEIHLYSKVLPAFRSLEKEFQVTDFFDSVPKCYKTLVTDNMEVLVLDNLKMLGYELHSIKPLNLGHLKKVVAEYGKFHALSFAFRNHKPTEFGELANGPNAMREFFKDPSVRGSFSHSSEQVLEILKEKKDFDLHEKFKSVLTKRAGELINDFLHEDISDTVVTHGDCWNNNFMFKYNGNDRTSPAKIAILDWQISSLGSPIFDLSHLLYCTSSKRELDKFEELLEVYHSSFSTHIRKFNCDPVELFPYSRLKSLWKKYSLYGLLFLPMIMKVILADVEDKPELADLKEGENFSDAMNIEVKNKDLYYDRVKFSLQHYFTFKFKD